ACDSLLGDDVHRFHLLDRSTFFAYYLDGCLNIEMNTLFKALNDPTRRKILELLTESDRTAGEIADAFSISKPSISHHLALLKQANLVEAEKRGQFVHYTLNTTVLDEVLTWLLTLFDAEEDSQNDEPNGTT
ncbi:MAG: autorepressor SdpR family transcription factor, partial [Rhodothermales bacterium]|nr:autorepressor SdpR family transcription factor [Rhodothermales bacterium]